MTRTTLTALLAALAALMLAPGLADAKPKNLWATVNICDTPRHPDSIGLRARMPGNGTHQRMYMRFVAQYRDGKRWRRVANTHPRWQLAGSAVYDWKEAGRTFRFKTPDVGVSYLMRGQVQFQWRKKRRHGHGWRVVRRAKRVTTGGHPGTDGSDPKGYSAARCRISTP